MRDMKLGTRIACGFGTILFITVVLGWGAIWRMKDAQEQTMVLARQFVPQVNAVVDLEQSVGEMMYELRGYSYTGDDKSLEAGKKAAGDIKKNLADLRDLAAKSQHLTKLKEMMGPLEANLNEYDKLIGVTVEKVEGLARNRQALDEAAADFSKHAYAYLEGQKRKMTEEIEADAETGGLKQRLQKIALINDVLDLLNWTRIANFKAQALRDSEITKQALGNFPKIEQKITELLAITAQESDKKDLAQVLRAARDYKTAMTDPSGSFQALLDVNNKRRELGNAAAAVSLECTKTALQRIDSTSDELSSMLSASSRLMIYGLILAVLLGAALAFAITRGILKPINTVIDGLTEGSQQVVSASGQVASASQQLAEGASEQAAALEQTSSAIEQLSATSRQNADNAGHANALMSEVMQVVDTSTASMRELTESMDEITKASEDTSRIIKTIDEIAFQTNLLALNAAVEAARAGEAGAGFAVVADEVRNLAMRAAEAAKNTAGLIEGTVKKIKHGSGTVEKTNRAFAMVVEHTQKVGELIGEIAASSQEQSRGAEEITRAVTEMDRVVQQNASNSEESAAASEELNAQAEQMKEFVSGLVALVGEKAKNASKRDLRGIRFPSAGTTPATIQDSTITSAGWRNGDGKGISSPRKHGREIHSDQIIPLNEVGVEEI